MNNTATKTNQRFETLLAKYAAILDRTHRELAMNFETPAPLIVGTCCAVMGITAREWHALEGYKIAKEQAVS